MPLDSVAPLVDALRAARVLEPGPLAELDRLGASFPGPRALAGELIRRGWLTPYQANQLLQGKGADLLLGSYVLLERLGEGGMGQVFKARHWKLGKVVALKLIRKERLENPDAVRRFQREIHAAAQLDHPNIVRAIDADEVDGTHLLVMEYVPGADLAQLVKQAGPLPVDRACDYIRQAALGLQHASERGLVHRDIKPPNLLLTPQGVVKILDMGLARLNRGDDGEGISVMTVEGAVMGTPDYMAPEQALDSHSVDIRADLYSLGCTLYFLLTGKVPFPGGSLGEKIARHQMREPQPVEQLRPGTPPGVAAVLRKLMAKRPEDRYQTPAEAAAALDSAVGAAGATLPATVVAGPAVGAAAPEGLADLRTPDATGADTTPPAAARRRRRPAPQRRRIAVYAAGGLLSLALAVLFVVLIRCFAPPEKRSPESPPDARPPTFDQWVRDTAALPVDRQAPAVADKLKELNPGFDGRVRPTVEGGVVTGLEFLTDQVTEVSPLRALPGLRELTCHGTEALPGKLADLAPLRGLRLQRLDCNWTKVADLAPLRDMPLAYLSCYAAPVADLSPVKSLPLTYLDVSKSRVADLAPLRGTNLKTLSCEWTSVRDLSPLKNVPLTELNCGGTPVDDLSPLQGKRLEAFSCFRTRVTDFSPLGGMPLRKLMGGGMPGVEPPPLAGAPLTEIAWDFNPWRDAGSWRSIQTLERINGKPAAEFWKDADARQAVFDAWAAGVAALSVDKQAEAVGARLRDENPDYYGEVRPTILSGVVVGLEFPPDDVTDLGPVRALKGLRSLVCISSPGAKGKLADLGPLRGLPLTRLVVPRTQVADLRPLRGMPLTALNVAGTQVRDLSPLKGMPLTLLNCGSTAVADLSPLADMPLRELFCERTAVVDLAPLRKMPLQRLMCDFRPERNAEILRSIRTLEQINGKPAAEFWKTAGGAP